MNNEINKIKTKKNVKIFDKQELDIKREIENNINNDNIDFREYIKDKQPFPLKEGTGKNLLDNNVVLIRPQILPSTKQIQYQNQLNSDPNNYFYLLIKQLNKVKHGNIAEKDILEKIAAYEKYISELHIQKFKDKLNLEGQNLIKKDRMEVLKTELDLSQIKSETDDSKSEDSYIPYLPRKLTMYDKIWNCCCRSPLKPYSLIRRKWAGENGIFKKQFQDNRDYN